jgi:hypothetical protein
MVVFPQDLRNDVYRELVDPITVAGTPFRWLPSLQSMLKVRTAAVSVQHRLCNKYAFLCRVIVMAS